VKKYLPYILALLLIGALVTLFATGNNKKDKQLDERITLRRQDKIPYGTYVAFKGLDYLFPSANVYTNRYEPGYWDSLSYYKSDQVLIIVAGKFNADEAEMKKMISFIEGGNDVFISTRTISYSAGEMMECSVKEFEISSDVENLISKEDTLNVALTTPPFGKLSSYTYPGKKLDASFSSFNNKTTEVLGENEQGKPNFIRLRAGKGNLYLHLAPLAFTNYFLLHKDNIRYYEKAFSVINPAAKTIVWDEYYLNKKLVREDSEKKGWFSVLINTENDNGKKPFKAAFLLAIILLILYVLFEMRRKQRIIPVVKQPRNDSMDFVKTIGRLYFDKGDHKNLCRKMSAYFLEHVRNKYKLLTGTMDEEFIKKLQYKSGADEESIKNIVFFIKYLEDAPAINHKQLNNFHQQLESFYKIA
jgi:hypothetical protein